METESHRGACQRTCIDSHATRWMWIELMVGLAKMNNGELLRFGKPAAAMCSPEANLGKPPREAFVIQLGENLRSRQVYSSLHAGYRFGISDSSEQIQSDQPLKNLNRYS